VTKLKLLVTGGCGFIGSNFVRYMLKKYPNYKIANFGKLTYAGNSAKLKDFESNPDFSLVHENICHLAIVNRFMEKIDQIIYFPAKVYIGRSIGDGQISARKNVIETHPF
jgi:dTDP-glucose 4,6-dehydratase